MTLIPPSLNETIRWEEHPAGNVLSIDDPICKAKISEKGAQLLSFKPKLKEEESHQVGDSTKYDEDWLWLSPSIVSDKAIRGGIPICFPWFGVNQENPQLPKHGFVRDQLWQLAKIEERENSVYIQFSFDYQSYSDLAISQGLNKLWKDDFKLEMNFYLSNHIDIEFNITHQGPSKREFSFALHSYFAINNILEASVTGLEGKHYLDNTQGLSIQTQSGPVEFTQEVDRVYESTTQAQLLKQSLHSQLKIDGQNCPTCIVWNPGEKLAQKIDDIKDCFQDYVCVERGAAFADSIDIEPLQKYNMRMSIYKELF